MLAAPPSHGTNQPSISPAFLLRRRHRRRPSLCVPWFPSFLSWADTSSSNPSISQAAHASNPTHPLARHLPRLLSVRPS
ncbi:uncharacterized protein K452DRAFT_31690 [Aplosporella prunicola CBS 121167]|uniref:Uncharacterized protein n=1 Tax=Aplosporella prunicola CBS 121167 TaxID=1176127 RepID=A0A6A6BBP9_9PEZI|nr:uncharacterized protein K452DRAFT_31690 [Aplosporella prunicola CBS 121167]KAF2141662.1 hypothetical protein K452DRAFT_31690 [Aplosporella prunicola CBS 121167]